jgi:hypothetical protein
MSDGMAISQLAKCMNSIVQLGDPIFDLPVIGGLIRLGFEASESFIDKAVTKVPMVGPHIKSFAFKIVGMMKLMLIESALRRAVKRIGVPLEKVSDLVRKMASMDAYVDDAFESLFEVAAPAAGAATHQVNKTQKESRVMRALQRALEDMGPSKAFAILKQVIVEFLEIELVLATNFLRSLTPKEMMELGRPLLRGKFDFHLATKLSKFKTSVVTFTVKTGPGCESVDDEKLKFSWGSPPTLTAFDRDWAAEAAMLTGTEEPMRLDNLLSVNGTPAKYMTKDEFEQIAADTQQKGDAQDLVLKFRRGLDVNFAQRFREKIPSMLRQRLGVPFDEGHAVARAVTTEHMQTLLRILLFGGMKAAEDLSDELQVRVNWENAYRDHVKTELVRNYGFTLHAAARFAKTLDNSTGSSLSAFLTRILQLVGCSTLGGVQRALLTGDIVRLEKIHSRLQRGSLARALSSDGTVTLAKVANMAPELCLTEDAGFAMIKTEAGQEVAVKVHRDVARQLLETWQSLLKNHANAATGPLLGYRAFDKDRGLAFVEAIGKPQEKNSLLTNRSSSRSIVANLRKSATQMVGRWSPVVKYTWPTNAIQDAIQATTIDDSAHVREVARDLFYVALTRTCHGIFEMYDEVLVNKAIKQLGYEVSDPSDEELKKKGEFDLALCNWMRALLESLPPARTQGKKTCQGIKETRQSARGGGHTSHFEDGHGVERSLAAERPGEQTPKDVAGAAFRFHQQSRRAVQIRQRNPTPDARAPRHSAPDTQVPRPTAANANDMLPTSTPRRLPPPPL